VILGIDHIGVATSDPAQAAAFLDALEMSPAESGPAEDYGVACQFWRYPGQPAMPAIEIVSPTQDDSAIAGRLTRDGPGLYHIAFAVQGIEAELNRLRAASFSTVDSSPRCGAIRGMRVAFMYARRPAGLLIELVEYGDP
jgi:methylmalonyl-CoA/ethylmalonyl-CoA epimerase